MTQHTQGEWIAKGTEVFCGEHRIASTAIVCNSQDAATDKANARLIAAAPQLLEALEELFFISNPGVFGGSLDDARESARAAIALAKGE
jgi:hypothetical protein